MNRTGNKGSGRSAWLWVPTLYFAEGIPYFIVNVISVIMFKRLGMGNSDIAVYTGLLYLPWVIKPLWAPFVDIIRSKRFWIVTCQVLVTVFLVAAALSIPHGRAGGLPRASTFTLTLIIFWLTAFASATHDIAADGFYMLALDEGRQSLFVGVRSFFYRLSSIFGQGVLVVVAGLLETRTGKIPLAWTLTLLLSSVIFAAITLYHAFLLPVAESPGKKACPEAGFSERSKELFKEFGRTFVTFFRKKGVVMAMVFLLLYRLPEALLLKMLNPFLLDPATSGGLGLSTEQVGLVYGTVGVLALILGGILGGMAASRWGLKKSLLPMSLCLALPCTVYLFLAVARPESLLVVNACVALDQFGYGFGFTAYMLYMMYFSEGEFKTAHYSLCTAFMALSMMLPGMVAGRLEEWLGYRGFFLLVVLCCAVTIAVALCVKVDSSYGKLRKGPAPTTSTEPIPDPTPDSAQESGEKSLEKATPESRQEDSPEPTPDRLPESSIDPHLTAAGKSRSE